MTRQARIASLAAMLACVFLAATVKAVIVLTTPATVTTQAVWANGLNCRVPANDTAPVQCFISYAYTDGGGNLVQGFSGGTAGSLSTSDIVALLSTPAQGPNNLRNRIQVALQSNLGAASVAAPFVLFRCSCSPRPVMLNRSPASGLPSAPT